MKETKRKKFSEETIQSLVDLGKVLLRIHKRLVAEGKTKVVNGKVVFLK